LGNCHTLELRGCNKITDEGIKHLGNCHTLGLCRCNLITDKGIKYVRSKGVIVHMNNII
jgi:bacterioferritin-associated ferredoxin